jgi:DNA-binding response OmpR family regulator
MNILLLDGYVTFRRALTEYLTRRGFLVYGASTTSEALAALEASMKEDAERFDVIVFETDNNKRFLPRASELAPHLPYIVVTGNPDWEQGVNLFAGGNISGYLSKADPDLYDKIADYIRNQVVIVRHGPWLVNLRDFSTTWHGRDIHLTPTETQLFAHFLRNPNRRILYPELAKVAGHDDLNDLSDARYKMKATVSNMRIKLRDATGREVINSAPRLGFRLLPESDGIEDGVGSDDDEGDGRFIEQEKEAA